MKRTTRISLAGVLVVGVLSGGRRAAQADLNVWSSGGPGGGNIVTIAVDPVHPMTLYAGAGRFRGGTYTEGSGGIFKSTDGGATWKRTHAGVTNPLVNVVAIDPHDSTVVYAATDGGVSKSLDAASHWHDTGLTGVVVEALAVAPATTATLYAASGGTVFTTTDSGDTWSSAEVHSNSPFDVEILALAADPTTAGTVYAGANLGVFKSTDRGATWRETDLEFCAGCSGGPTIDALAIDPEMPAIVYAGGGQGFGRTTDGGGDVDLWSGCLS